MSAVLQKKHGPRDGEEPMLQQTALLPEPVTTTCMVPPVTPPPRPPPQSPPKISLRPLKRWGSDSEHEAGEATTILEKIAFNTCTVPTKSP